MITPVINSFKGGTAKTSTALHLGAALAKFYKKQVLLIDFDSQANLSSGLGFGCDCLDTMVPVLQSQANINDVIKKTSVPGLYLIPGNTYLDGVERTHSLASDPYSHERLRKAIQPLDFDFTIIDVPPSLSWLTQSAHFASDHSIIASVAEPYSVLALNRLAKFHNMINEHHVINLLGVLLSMWDSRNATNSVFVEGIFSFFSAPLSKGLLVTSILCIMTASFLATATMAFFFPFFFKSFIPHALSRLHFLHRVKRTVAASTSK